MLEREYFKVNACRYISGNDFYVYRPASLNNPKNNAVMFITEAFMSFSDKLRSVTQCLVYWPISVVLPEDIALRHAVVLCSNPHFQYCMFFKENNIENLPKPEVTDCIGGAFISRKAKIGANAVIFPGVYIGGDVTVGDNVYIGSGARLIGEIHIGNNVEIRENAVIGADGLTTDRDENGKAVTMPQFGGVVMEDNVQIGANTVVARGAIDDTIIKADSKIDNSCFISHNVIIGADTFIVGETIMFGSSSTGDRVLISGNSIVGNYVNIGDDSVLGIGSSAIKDIPPRKIAYGTPAKVVRDR